MKKIIFIAILFLGCNSHKEFRNTDLKNISVYKFYHNEDEFNISNYADRKICTLTNTDTINVLLSALKNKKPVARIFIPEYIVTLNYVDKIIDLSVSQNYIKIKGKTYKVKINLSEYFISTPKY